MKVQELSELLKGMPQQAEVLLETDNFKRYPILYLGKEFKRDDGIEKETVIIKSLDCGMENKMKNMKNLENWNWKEFVCGLAVGFLMTILVIIIEWLV